MKRAMVSKAPVTERAIPLCVPEISGNEWKYVKECLDSGWVSSVGSFVDRFEHQLASYVGAKFAVATVNGTAALHTALKVVGLQPDEEVLVSNLTFVAPVNAIRYCQAHPVLMDAHPETWQMDTGKVASFLTNECEVRDGQCYNRHTGRRVRAILPVHLLGLACEIDQIVDLARKHNLRVVEDAAEAIGVRYQGRHVGTFGDIGVFSFNGNKIITTGGGGMLVTSNPAYGDYARYLTTQAKDDELEYIHNEVGYNYRLTNIQAALGVAQLEQIGGFIERKHAIARAYEEALSDLGGVTTMPTPPHTTPTYWLYTILLNDKTTLEKRKAIVRKLNARGVGARPLWHPIHGLPPYRGCQAFQIEHSVRLYEQAVSLPSSAGLETNDLKKSVAALKRSIAEEG